MRLNGTRPLAGAPPGGRVVPHENRMVVVDLSLKRPVLPGSVALACLLAACGGGSELDDYTDGVPDVVPEPGAAKGATGSACASADDCKGTDAAVASCATSMNLSTLASNVTFTGGYCTNACTTSAECPTGSTCLNTPRRCVATCLADTDCRSADGYKCQTSPSGGSSKVCLPPLPSNPLGGFLGGLLGN